MNTLLAERSENLNVAPSPETTEVMGSVAVSASASEENIENTFAQITGGGQQADDPNKRFGSSV